MLSNKTRQMKKFKKNDQNHRQPSITFCTPTQSKVVSYSTPNSEVPLHLNVSGKTAHRHYSANQICSPFHQASFSEICVDGSNEKIKETESHLMVTLQMLNSLIAQMNTMFEIIGNKVSPALNS